MSEQCYTCGSTEDELRPYGINGAWVCFHCAMGTPEAKRIAEQQFEAQVNAAAKLSKYVIIGEPTGPRPHLPNKDLQ